MPSLPRWRLRCPSTASGDRTEAHRSARSLLWGTETLLLLSHAQRHTNNARPQNVGAEMPGRVSTRHSPLTAEPPCSPGAPARGRGDRECRRRHACAMALCVSGAGGGSPLRAERWGQALPLRARLTRFQVASSCLSDICSG